jgi:competence protein ComEA
MDILAEVLRQQRGYLTIVLLNLTALAVIVFRLRDPAPGPIEILPPPTPTPAQPTAVPLISVYVSGAVQRSDVVRLPEGSRVKQAVEAAGGLSADAQAEAVNLAQLVADGQQIHVPRLGEAAVAQPPVAAAADEASVGAAVATAGPVNINTATVAQLETLPGIGPALAQRIVDYRQANGPFAAPEDIVAVSGIGEKTFQKLAPYITVR